MYFTPLRYVSFYINMRLIYLSSSTIITITAMSVENPTLPGYVRTVQIEIKCVLANKQWQGPGSLNRGGGGTTGVCAQIF